jgi:hypothetical protein
MSEDSEEVDLVENFTQLFGYSLWLILFGAFWLGYGVLFLAKNGLITEELSYLDKVVVSTSVGLVPAILLSVFFQDIVGYFKQEIDRRYASEIAFSVCFVFGSIFILTELIILPLL